jgi:hypothetical protein
MPSYPILKPLARIGLLSLLLIVLVLTGFWNSYFSKLPINNISISFYFHVHAIIVSMWIVLLILQPLFIVRKNLKMHRLIGKISYAVFPLMVLSIIWVSHFSFTTAINPTPIQLFIPFKDVLLLCVMFSIGVCFKSKPMVHAKAMIATGIICMEPALIRTVMLFMEPTLMAYPITITIIYMTILVFILYEWKHSSGRWIMLGLLFALILSHSFILSGCEISYWNHFTIWFSNLPLT